MLIIKKQNNMIDQKSLNGSQRPRSAIVGGQFASNSFGQFFQQQGVLDEKTVAAIWKGFGSYLAKELRNGRGVSVPKFGQFTFTSTIVDLSGTTNPGDRDKQFREPVFIVGKDFVSAVYIKSGMAHNRGAQVRPFDNKGASGIIPKVKINYTEVGALCIQNKDICKSGCEQVFRFLSDKARKGEPVQMDIPFVGQFIVRNGIAAISFNQDLCEDTKGVTAKNHFVSKLFSSNGNKHNLQLIDNNLVKANPNQGLGGAIKVSNDAEAWLKSNLNINVNDLVYRTIEHRGGRRLQSAHPNNRPQSQQISGTTKNEEGKGKSWAIKQSFDGILTEQNKQIFDQMSEGRAKTPQLPRRPLSAVTRVSNNSRMSNVPDVSRMRLAMIAGDIFKNRQVITDHQKNENGNLRDKLSSSEIQSLLKRIGIVIEIGNVKALLKELGFNWNGKACSMLSLFLKCQEFLSAQESKENLSTLQNPQYKTILDSITGKNKSQYDDFIQKIKDLFYSTKKSIYEIFQEAKTGNGVDNIGLNKIVQKYSANGVPSEQIDLVFKQVSNGSDSLSYQEFERIFNWSKPAGSDWETRCFRGIREWMFKNQLSSETAFELMLTKANRVLQKRLTRFDFHTALSELELKFSAPEVDGLFKILDHKQDGELDIEEWTSRVYCDTQNPLQMLREVISQNKLTSDDILFRMNLRIWDSALDFPKFCECLRKLDPSLSESQLRALAKSLKNKESKIDVPTLLTNLSGKDFETVDYRNKVFKMIYAQIYPKNDRKLLKLLESADSVNDGKVEPAALKAALSKVTAEIEPEMIDRFVRFLDKDNNGKIDYIAFIDRMSEVSNRDHNPFKSVVQRLQYFIQSNNQTAHSIIKRLSSKAGQSTEQGISIDYFAEFLRAKIDKKRNDSDLRRYAHYIDIDKDGFVSEIDLQTCLDNLGSDAFFRDGGEAQAVSAFSSQKKFYPVSDALTGERALEIAKQIKAALISQRIAPKEAFTRFDSNKNGFLSFQEFSAGIDSIMTMSVPVKEKFFALMDKNQIGLVDYPNFLEVIQSSSAKNIKKNDFSDSFDWENSVIEQIKSWVLRDKITVEEAFKCFDRDFDGFIKKDDLKWGIINILKIKEEEILPTKLDRLFRLMDFYKTNQIQPSDFQRLLNDSNPYSSSGQRQTASSDKFRKSFGGSLGQTSTFNWKMSAIQQIGLTISKKYASLKESFEDASELLQKITFDQFRKFIDKTNALNGFNMTLPLTQKLFAELDPHKKGYLTENDWSNALQAFKHTDQILIELKNAVQCSFSDCESAYSFFLSFKQGNSNKKTIGRNDFEKAVISLSAGRFGKEDVDNQWKHLTENGKYLTLDKYIFRSHFDNIQYSGVSSVREVKTANAGTRTTIVSVSSSNSQWETDIIEKLRQIIKSSNKSFEDIFREFDEDGNGSISQNEFRNAIRRLNLGLSSREIDKLMTKVDKNADGKIDWQEFMGQFQTTELDERLKERSRDKMARLKELMVLHMTSPIDAFRFFDESKLGKLSYQEFSKLVDKSFEVAGDKIPSYPVIKDLFDTIDIRKDGIIDMNEWQQSFGFVNEGNSKLSIKTTPLALWENTREYQRIGTLIAKNRKLLKDQFTQINGGTTMTYDQAKTPLLSLLQHHFNTITDEKLKVILKVGEVHGATEGGLGNRYDIERLLNVYKNRHAAPQL